MDNLATAVDNILKQSEDVSRRLASIENNMHSANYPGSSADLTTQQLDDNLSMIAVDDLTITRNDDATIAPLNHNTSNTKPTIPLATGPQLDSSLGSAILESRVYARLAHRRLSASIAPDLDSVNGMSFLSSTSLAQVSNISVLSLPVSRLEIWNSQHYRETSDIGIESSNSKVVAIPLRQAAHIKAKRRTVESRMVTPLPILRESIPLWANKSVSIAHPFTETSGAIARLGQKPAKIMLLGKWTHHSAPLAHSKTRR